MHELYLSLKSYYEKFLLRGKDYGLSPDIIHENALNLFIKILALFLISPWSSEYESKKIMEKSNRNLRIEIQEYFFLDVNTESTLLTIERSPLLKSLMKVSYVEMQLKDSLSNEEWDELFDLLESQNWSIREEFKNSSTITPEFLSYFYENILNDYENLFSLKSKISKRKGKGVFYTGWDVIKKITDTCLDKYISNNPHLFHQLPLMVKILDPSCGTGSFLVYAAESLYQRIKSTSIIQPYDILEKCLYGVDLTSSCLIVAKIRLLCWLVTHSPNMLHKSSKSLFINIKSGNSLFGLCKEKVQYPLDYYSVLQKIIDSIDPITKFKEKEIDEMNKNWLLVSKAVKDTELKLLGTASVFDSTATARRLLSSLFNTFYRNLIIVKGALYPKAIQKSMKFNEQKLFHWGQEFPEVLIQGGFDIIVGNPPYGRSILSKNEKNILKLLFKSCSGKEAKKYSLNAASAFIERSYDLLIDHGVIGLIVPYSILRVEEFESLRRFLLDNSTIWRIDDESAAFSDVTLEMCSIYIIKKPQKEYNVEIQPRLNVKSLKEIPVEVFRRYKRFMIYYDDLWDRISNMGKMGVVSGDYGIDHRIVKKDLISQYTEKYTIPFLHSGRSVSLYALNSKYFHWSKPHPRNQRFSIYFNEPRIINTAIGNKFRAAYKPEKIIPGTNVSILEVPSDYDYFTMLILLNSELINYLLKRYILNFSSLTVYLHKYYTRMIPIKYPKENISIFSILATYLIFLYQCSINEVLNLDKRLEYIYNLSNYLVYDLYFPEILNLDRSLASVIGEYLKPIEIHAFLDIISDPKPDKISAQTLTQIINSNQKIIYRVTNELRTKEVLKEYKSIMFNDPIVKQIRRELV